MKKVCILSVLLSIGALNVFAQKGEEYVVDNKSNFMDRVYFGGGMGLSGGSWGTAISLSPIVGYMVSSRFSLGVGATYQFYKYTSINFQDNRYGGSAFARMNIVKQVFAYGEYSFLNQVNYFDLNDRVTITRLPIGLGVSQYVGPRSSLNLVVAYDMLHDTNYLYHPSPWVVTVNFSL